MLSRRNLGLQIEKLADKWLVSLVDLTTGRVAASTKVDALPADREAAVATLTHVTAELAAQLVGRAEPPIPLPPPAAPAPTSAPAPDDRAERAAREIADLTFQRESIRFGKVYLLGVGAVSTGDRRNWTAYRGELDESMEPDEFYREVGRPDLIASYRRRRIAKWAGYGVGVAAIVVSVLFLPDRESCSSDLPDDEYIDCLGKTPPSSTRSFVALSVGCVGLLFGMWYLLNPHPIRENEAKALANAYNQRLRTRLHLPVVSQRPMLHDIKLAPYVTGHDAGLALTARF